MTALLRVIAASIGLFVLVPLLFFLWHFAEVFRGGGRGMPSVGSVLGMMALAAFIAVGVFAMHRLWHLKLAGLWAAVAIFSVLVSLFVVSALSGLRTSRFGFTLTAISLVILLLPQARRACS